MNAVICAARTACVACQLNRSQSVNSASAWTLARAIRALTVNSVPSMYPIREVATISSCLSAVISSSQASAHSWRPMPANALVNAIPMPIVVATTNAAATAVAICALLRRVPPVAPALLHRLLSTQGKWKPHWSPRRHRTWMCTHQWVVLQYSVASQLAIRHRILRGH